MTEEKKKIYQDWKDNVNMSKGELARFYDSEEGKKAGLSKSEASEQGIDYGRESARWILKMKDTTVNEWTDNMWRWAKKQNSFISRMSGVKGRLYNEKGEKTRKHLALLIWGHNPEKKAKGGKLTKEAEKLHSQSQEVVQFEPEGLDAVFMKRGGRTLAQTPAPPKERIYGSKVNVKGSAKNEKSAKEIEFSDRTIERLKNKVKEYNQDHKGKVTLETLKAVYRRGLGAYSSSHRPTISGGRPNTRNAWAMARVNKFLEKKAGKPVKKAYVQDDDLLENGGELGMSLEDIAYEQEGKTNDIKIALPDVYSSPETLQRVLNNQGYDLVKKETKSQEMEQSLSISQIAEKHNVSVEYLRNELVEGIKTEMEHTDNPEEAKKIALDHLNESPEYYQYLQKMEAKMKADMIDKHYSDIEMKYSNGGSVAVLYRLNTPTGETSRLSYIQQVLVRTTQFKNWFGDWQKSARNFLADNRQNFEKHFEGVSKVLDMVTLEPLAVYHGTGASQEFYEFDVSMDAGMGRPYGYFADNPEYSANFLRGQAPNVGQFYTCFLNMKRPFYAINDNFYGKREKMDFWLTMIAVNIFNDRYGFTIKDFTEYDKLNKDQQGKISDISNEIADALLKYVMDDVYLGSNTDLPFWMIMSKDKDSIFKRFLMREKYDGIRYAEEFTSSYDIDNPAEFTKAWTIFNSKQVKLADGRNIDFDPMKVDIRMANGGKTEEVKEEISVEQAPMSRSEKMRMEMGLDGTEKFNDGGTVYGDKEHSKDAKDGGYFVGNSHAKGGIKAVNKDTGQIIEVEGNEVIINKRSVADNTKREFEGKMLTNREILSKINEMGGGVKFANGGNTSEHCACSGKKYKFGGETLEDYLILSRLNQLSETVLTPSELAVNYVDDLTTKIYGI